MGDITQNYNEMGLLSMKAERIVTVGEALEQAQAIVTAIQEAGTREEAGAAMKRKERMLDIIGDALETGGMSPEGRGVLKTAQRLLMVDFMAAMLQTARRMREVA